MDNNQLIEYGVTDAAINELKEKFNGMTIANDNDYKNVNDAISVVRKYRTDVEKKRKELKADALVWGRKIDSEAKRITSLLLEVEEPLKLEKQKIDDAERLKKEEAERAERARIDSIHKMLADINSLSNISMSATSEEITERINEANRLSIDSRFEEFVGQARVDLKNVIEKLDAQLSERLKFERDRDDVARQFKELEYQRKKQEEEQRIIDQKRAEIDAVIDEKKSELERANNIARQSCDIDKLKTMESSAEPFLGFDVVIAQDKTEKSFDHSYNTYIVDVEFAGYSRGISSYKIKASSEEEARDIYYEGIQINRETVRDDTEKEVISVELVK